LCAVALGSDGARAWFLVADGMSARVPLDRDTSGRLMYLAGECAAVVLHRDVAREGGKWAQPRERFAGWPILRDIEGRESDEGVSRRISGRFLLARVLRGLVDDDLVMDPLRLSQDIDGVVRELGRIPLDEPERPFWDDVVRALQAADLDALAKASFALAKRVDEEGQIHGARELLGLTHRVAVAASAVPEAAESARLIGRWYRRRGEWDDSIRWYEAARAAARVGGQRVLEALAMDGQANTLRDKGNLPAARELLHEGLEVARESGDHYPLGLLHANLMSVEQRGGRLLHAVAHGWRAVNLLQAQEESRYHAINSMAGCLVKIGELDAAEDSYAVVAERVKTPDWRFAALGMLAYISALRGDRDVFEARAWRADEADWRGGASVPVHAQVLQYRGMSWRELGETARARAWFTRARDYAQEHGVNQVYFEAEAAILELENTRAAPPPTSRASAYDVVSEAAPDESGLSQTELAEIRGGMGAMRRELAPGFA
jgi:tetratricopeptide (TPR) repeat protein